MKLFGKGSLLAASVAAVVVVAAGAITFAVVGLPVKEEPKSAVVVEAPKENSTEVSEAPKAISTPESAQPAPVEEIEAEEPKPVRTFEEIILDYENMSTGAPGFPECAMYMKQAFPEMFREHNREANIKAVSERYTNVCTATSAKMDRSQMTSLEAHFKNYGVR